MVRTSSVAKTFAAVSFTVGLVALASPASAHVTVSAPGAAQGGGDQIITFRVPTESDTASTVGLKVQLPPQTPIASVLVQPIAGWSFTETSSKLATPIKTDDGDITEAVSEIDWKADTAAAGIAPGAFQQFVIIAGQLPTAPSITFKAIQTYSDNSVVNWTDVAAAGSTAELDHPAPVLTLGAATADGDAASASSSAGVAASSSGLLYGGASAPPSTKSSSSTGALIVGIVALVLAVAALGVAAASRKNSGSQAA